MLPAVHLAVGLLLSTQAGGVPAVGRRELLLQRMPQAAAAITAALAAQPALAADDLGKIQVLSAKAKGLRASVRATSAGRRKLPMDPTPGVNNYASTTDSVLRAKAKVLLPLQAAMAAYAATPRGLPEELQKQLALQNEYLKGHLSELDYYLGKKSFEEYVSKTTKATYFGGKVERELEEVCETTDDFLALARGQAVPVRED